MVHHPLHYWAQAAEGNVRQAADSSLLIRRVVTDSRQIEPGDLFVAIRGERHDGHDHLEKARQAGAAACLVREDWHGEAHGIPQVEVTDTRVGLGRMASRYALDHETVRIAVAGSNGKTSTKELLAAVLGTYRPTLKSPASFNNDIGLPLTLLQLEPDHAWAVLEIGTNHPGEVAHLLGLACPHHGILTSIGREHLEFFGNLQGVIDEEGALAEAIPSEGTLVLHADSPGVDQIMARCHGSVLRVGGGSDADWRIHEIHLDADGTTFRVDAPTREWSGIFRTQLLGAHQALNAGLALAMASVLGVPVESARQGLLACRPANMRMELRQRGGIRLLNDAYNANADSVLAALDTLRKLPCEGQRWAVLGDLAELGNQANEAHHEIGCQVAQAGIDQLLAVGQNAGITIGAAQSAGLSRARACSSVEQAGRILAHEARAEDLVLLKASRSAGLERIEETLCGEEAREASPGVDSPPTNKAA